MYDSYRFEENAVGVYNPFSTLNVLSALKFADYRLDADTPLPVIYQSGYLAIKAFPHPSLKVQAKDLR